MYDIDKRESLGLGQRLILHGNPSAIPKNCSPTAHGSPSTSFLPNMHFQCCMILLGTLGGNFDIFAARGEFTACVLLWKFRSRPTSVRVCPAAQFNSFRTAFDPREWTMVVFWKEDSGRQPQMFTLENEGGDETTYPSPPKITFFDDQFFLDLVDFPAPPEPHEPPAPSPAGGTERVEKGNTSHERLHLHPRPSPNFTA